MKHFPGPSRMLTGVFSCYESSTAFWRATYLVQLDLYLYKTVKCVLMLFDAKNTGFYLCCPMYNWETLVVVSPPYEAIWEGLT